MNGNNTAVFNTRLLQLNNVLFTLYSSKKLKKDFQTT